MTRTPSDEYTHMRRYRDVCTAIYTDAHLTPGAREVVLAVAWLTYCNPARRSRRDILDADLIDLLGLDPAGRPRAPRLIAEDLPRYVEPHDVAGDDRRCCGPRTRPYRPRKTGSAPIQRAPQICGAPPSPNHVVREWDPATGHTIKIHRFCARHAGDAAALEQRLSDIAGPRPTPLPNTGGQLAKYLGPEHLAALYRYVRPDWEPPVEGIDARAWTRARETPTTRRPVLTIVRTGEPPTHPDSPGASRA